MEYLDIHGPQFGYYLEQAKSWYICKAEDEEVARQAFEEKGLTIKYSRGRKYLGGFIGSADSKEDWLNEKVADWADAVETLAKIAVQYPQTAYAGFVFCLQAEWQYVSRVVPDTAAFFQPLEVCMWKYFCPALIGMRLMRLMKNIGSYSHIA